MGARRDARRAIASEGFEESLDEERNEIIKEKDFLEDVTPLPEGQILASVRDMHLWMADVDAKKWNDVEATATEDIFLADLVMRIQKHGAIRPLRM